MFSRPALSRSRSLLGALVLSVVGVLGAAGCNSAVDQAGADTRTEVTEGGILRIGDGGDLTPASLYSGAPAQATITGLVYDTLIRYPADSLDPQPKLATSWTVSEDKLSIDYYYWYYASLALNQFDGPDSPRASGKYWNPWNEALVPVLLELQDQTAVDDDCSRGGWIVPDRWSYQGGALYSTSMAVLTLEVYYRFANAFGSKAATVKAK